VKTIEQMNEQIAIYQTRITRLRRLIKQQQTNANCCPKIKDLEGLIAALPPNLSIRAENCFNNDNITTLEELIKRSRNTLARTPNLGRRTLDAIEMVLQFNGLKFPLIDDEEYNKRAEARWRDPPRGPLAFDSFASFARRYPTAPKIGHDW
jgi:DNA-directed RNA polymerase alpha subunit